MHRAGGRVPGMHKVGGGVGVIWASHRPGDHIEGGRVGPGGGNHGGDGIIDRHRHMQMLPQ